MVIKKVDYSREFLSHTCKENPECHKVLQEIAEEDYLIRKEIRDNFDLSCGQGFDGMQQYTYYINGKPDVPINTFENIKYKTTYFITKAGTQENINKPCELEDFLLTKEFEKIEKK
jgi:hypothetical protein